MARRRRRHSRRGHDRHRLLSDLILGGTFAGSFLGQVNQKDMASSSTYSGLSPTDQAKWQISNAVGRVTGWYPFQSLTPSKPVQINWTGWANKYTGLGLVATFLLPKVPGMPGKSYVRKAGAGLLAGGILGGLFDNPLRQGGGSSSQKTGPDMQFNGFNDTNF